MLKNSVLVLVLVAIMCNLLTGGELLFAQTESPKSPKIPEGVQVKVVITSAHKSIIKNEISKYVKRELRSLGDVKLTDSNPRYRIYIIANEIKTEKGYETGIIIPVVVTDALNSMNVRLLLNSSDFRAQFRELQIDKDNEEVINHLVNLAAAEEQVIYFVILMRVSGDLQSFCKQIVAWFDSWVLERDRKEAQQQLEELRKHQQNK